MRNIIFVALFLIVSASNTSISFAADLCREAEEKGFNSINAVYDPKLQLFLKISGALKEKGFDPAKFPVVMPDGSVESLNLKDMIENLAKQKSASYIRVREAVNECEKGFEKPQKIIDIAVAVSTGGLSLILPKHMAHVDASKILSGTIFGGKDALIPKLRDQVLNGLGIGGDVACIIRDPKKIFGGC